MYDGWGHDAGRTWNLARESDAFTRRFGPGAVTLQHRFYLHRDRLNRMGTLTVHIKSASDLINADYHGLSDPYVVQRCLGQTHRTHVIKKTLNPTWEHYRTCQRTTPSNRAQTSHRSTPSESLGKSPRNTKKSSSESGV